MDSPIIETLLILLCGYISPVNGSRADSGRQDVEFYSCSPRISGLNEYQKLPHLIIHPSNYNPVDLTT